MQKLNRWGLGREEREQCGSQAPLRARSRGQCAPWPGTEAYNAWWGGGMVNSLLDSLPPEGLSAGREPRRVPLQAPSRLSAHQTRTWPWGDVPLSHPFERPFLGSQTAAVERGALWEPPSPLTTVQALWSLSAVWAEGHVLSKLQPQGVTRKTLTLLLSGVKPGLQWLLPINHHYRFAAPDFPAGSELFRKCTWTPKLKEHEMMLRSFWGIVGLAAEAATAGLSCHWILCWGPRSLWIIRTLVSSSPTDIRTTCGCLEKIQDQRPGRELLPGLSFGPPEVVSHRLTPSFAFFNFASCSTWTHLSLIMSNLVGSFQRTNGGLPTFYYHFLPNRNLGIFSKSD